jgi:hypothetical protein
MDIFRIFELHLVVEDQASLPPRSRASTNISVEAECISDLNAERNEGDVRNHDGEVSESVSTSQRQLGPRHSVTVERSLLFKSRTTSV